MAGAAVEIADAYLALYAKMPGVGKDIEGLVGGSEVSGAVDGAASKLGGKFSAGFKKALGAAALTAGVVGAFKGLYEIGEVFDDVTDTIRVGTGATGEDLEALSDIAIEVGKTIPTSFADAGQTVADLNTRLGLSGDTLETVASQYLEAGRILGEEVDINATSAAFSAFKIEGDAVSGAMDYLFQVSQATGVGMNELATNVQQAAPAMRNLGFSFEETAALAGSLDKAGIDSAATFSAMGKGLVRLARDGEEPQEAFRRVAGELDALVAAGETAAATELATGVFGQRAALDMVAAVQAGTLAFDDLVGAAGLSGDTILGVGEETQDFAEKWQVVQNNAQAALEPLASAVFDALGDALDFLMPGLEAFGAWLGENTWAIPAFIGLIGALTVAWIAYSIAQWAVNAATMAFPLTPIILGIVLLIAAIVALVVNWDAVVAWLTEVWNGFIGWITGVIEGFVGWWNGVWEGFGNWITSVWEGFVGWIQGVWQGFIDWIVGILVGYVTFWMGVWQGISDFVAGIWNGIVSFISDAINNVWTFITDVVNGIRTTWEGVWNGIGSFLKDTWNNILGWIEGGVNGAIDLINGMTGGIRDVLAVVGIEVGAIPHISIPRLAAGAIVEARPGGIIANIGEGRYDEVVQPLGGPQFDRLADALAAKLEDEDAPLDLSEETLQRLVFLLSGALRVRDRAGVAQ